jgi:hypothetical protein
MGRARTASHNCCCKRLNRVIEIATHTSEQAHTGEREGIKSEETHTSRSFLSDDESDDGSERKSNYITRIYKQQQLSLYDDTHTR